MTSVSIEIQVNNSNEFSIDIVQSDNIVFDSNVISKDNWRIVYRTRKIKYVKQTFFLFMLIIIEDYQQGDDQYVCVCFIHTFK